MALLQGNGAPEPAMNPPSGETTNLNNPQNSLLDSNIAAQIISLSIAGVTFILRCYVRLAFNRLARSWTMEDWMVSLSFAGLLTLSTLVSLMIHREHGGTHQWNITMEQLDSISSYCWTISVAYGPIICLTKISILLLYLRLLVPARWSLLWMTIRLLFITSIVFYAVVTCLRIWQCRPISDVWRMSLHAKCLHYPVLLGLNNAFNIVTDTFILVIPINTCWKLQMSRRKRLGVCAVFAIGAIALIMTILGTVCRVIGVRSSDFAFYNAQIALWSDLEVAAGVICACLPTLPILFRRPSRQPSYPHIPLGRIPRPPTSGSETSTDHIVYHNFVEYGESRGMVSSHTSVIDLPSGSDLAQRERVVV